MTDAPPVAPTTAAGPDAAAERLFQQIMMDPANENPYPGYHELRDRAPALITSDGTLVLTRHADCDAALRHRSLGKGNEIQGFRLRPIPEERLRELMDRLERSMSFANPPDHSRLRRVVSSAFTGRHIENLRPAVTERVDALLDGLAAEPGADFMAGFAQRLPVGVVGDLLGVPEQDRSGFGAKVAALAAMVEPTADADTLGRAITAESELAAYFTDLLADKREHPADDLLSRLVGARDEESLDDAETVATALLLLGAGIETTGHLLANTLTTLLGHPAALDALRADPALIPGAVEEVLRYDSPVQFDARTVLEPVSFAGAELEPGQTVTIMLAAGNYDPARFDAPDTFDIRRTDNAHLSFAAGIHFCLGAGLARLEVQVFLERLLARHPSVSLAGTPRRRPGLGLRGFERIPVTLGP
ncbi:Cytochrome P450 [Actinomadura meyerae]|uniref:Cytochrome P450 n=1 Tax=Actinomadura meyerae TaxID=240840 RepID=A0A239NBD2_9ACTN|nr:cytochrome P450 [Actinomadura meyerae]SNT52211.1 Cytochrome P450 [Actinomadura meyerae]